MKKIIRIDKKLKSQKGTSLLLALMFFLTCILAGMAVFAMAQTYEKCIAVRLKEEAEYLAALSAEEFLKDQLEGCQGTWSLDASGIDMESDIENEVQRELLDTLYRFCKEYGNHSARIKKEMNLEMALEDDPDGDWAIPDVEVYIIFEPDDEAYDVAERLEEDLEEESQEYTAPIRLKAEFSLVGKKDRIMSLYVTGLVTYKAGEFMEVYWEEIEIGR